ncbi:MAG: hypothetical protein ACK5MN_11765 [Lachnospiraceae bacterium]
MVEIIACEKSVVVTREQTALFLKSDIAQIDLLLSEMNGFDLTDSQRMRLGRYRLELSSGLDGLQLFDKIRKKIIGGIPE